MKLNFIAIAIPAFIASGAANAVDLFNDDDTKLDLYGRVYALDYLGDASKIGNTTARLGIKAESKISDGVFVYSRFESETDTFDGDIDNRYAFVGFNFSNMSSLTYGKNDGVLRAISYYTDVLPEFGGDSEHYTILGGRTASVLTYSNKDFFGLMDGLDLALQYSDKNSTKFSDSDAGISVAHEAYGLNAQYVILDSDFTIGAAYSQADKDNSYIIGINYNAYNLYFSAIYNQTQVSSTKYSGYEMVAAHGIGLEECFLILSAAYISYIIDTPYLIDTTYRDLYAELGAQFKFNSHITAIADYKINLNPNESNQIALGLIYNF